MKTSVTSYLKSLSNCTTTTLGSWSMKFSRATASSPVPSKVEMHRSLSGSEKYCLIISGEEFRINENLKQGHAAAFV